MIRLAMKELQQKLLAPIYLSNARRTIQQVRQKCSRLPSRRQGSDITFETTIAYSIATLMANGDHRDVILYLHLILSIRFSALHAAVTQLSD